MMRFFMNTLKGAITLLLLAMTTVMLGILILLVFSLSCLLPVAKWRHVVHLHFLQKIPAWHMWLCRKILWISTRHLWDVQGTGQLKQEGWYLMVSNHQSWIDILVLGAVFNHLIPALKFFMKKELLWQLPAAGLACYALGYPFVARHSHADIRKNPKLKGRDVETTINACHHLEKFPTTLINFIEGTRFTEKKHAKQNSPFKYLLKPRAGGLSIALQAMHPKLDGIINVTILYPGKKPSIWDFASGNFKKIVVRYELLPITSQLIGNYQNDRAFRADFQQWLNSVWQKDDDLLGQLVKEYENGTHRS